MGFSTATSRRAGGTPDTDDRPEPDAPAGGGPSSIFGRLVARPEFGALVAAVAIFATFTILAGDKGFLSKLGTQNYLEVAAELGIVTALVCLLMIAGEFDISVGSMIGAAGILTAALVVNANMPLVAVIPIVLVCAGAVGVINGMLVVRTGLPSFIVTLAALFILRGLAIALTTNSTSLSEIGGIRGALENDPLMPIFVGKVAGYPAAIGWWIAITIIGAWVLSHTKFGNWIFAVGGDKNAARNSGVPVNRVKVILFIGTASAAALVGIIATLTNGTADVLQGTNREFQVITAAVIGGTLLTGGYGSVYGAAIGALMFGMISQGLFFTGLDNNYFQVALGIMLLAAVAVNQFTRRRALVRR